MNMKYKYFWIIPMFVIIGLFSCTDDGAGLLDKAESGDLDEGKVFTNGNYANDFLTDIYRRLPNGWNENLYLDAASDIGEARQWGGWANKVHTGAYNSSNLPNKVNRWADYYAAIRACNVFLAHIDEVPIDSETMIPTEEVREARKYEAYALRAYFYTELVRCYGGVPIVDKVLDENSPELYSERADLQEMKDFILSDCELAASHLVTRQTGNEYPRMTSAIAKGIKARFLLHVASPLFNSDKDAFGHPQSLCAWSWGSYNKERWKEAADAAKDLIYHLDPSTGSISYKLYEKTEKSDFFGNKASYLGSMKAMGYYYIYLLRSNTEMMMVHTNQKNSNQLEGWQLPGSIKNTGVASFTLPTYNYAAMFETKEGIPVYLTDDYGMPLEDGNGNLKVNPLSGFDPQNPNVNRDSRYYHSLFYQGAKFGGKEFEVWRSTDGQSIGRDYLSGFAMTGFYLRKFLDPKNITINGTALQGQVSHAFPHMRIAEFILGYAEAMNEYLEDGADRSEVIEELDKIRKRVDMPDVNTTFKRNGWNVTDKKQMRKFIQNERTVEMAFEDQRFYDIRRWMIGSHLVTIYVQDVIKNEDGKLTYNVKPWERRIFKERDHLLPIPQAEVNNNRNLKQNPGW